jgi:hypothetical protein
VGADQASDARHAIDAATAISAPGAMFVVVLVLERVKSSKRRTHAARLVVDGRASRPTLVRALSVLCALVDEFTVLRADRVPDERVMREPAELRDEAEHRRDDGPRARERGTERRAKLRHRWTYGSPDCSHRPRVRRARLDLLKPTPREGAGNRPAT